MTCNIQGDLPETYLLSSLTSSIAATTPKKEEWQQDDVAEREGAQYFKILCAVRSSTKATRAAVGQVRVFFGDMKTLWRVNDVPIMLSL